MSRADLAAACAVLALSSAAAFAAAPAVVDQVHRAFSVREIHIPRGSNVQFNNVDEFLHQLYVDNPDFKFSSAEQAPGQAISITFRDKGTFPIRCEIHPKMAMTVFVE